MTQRVAVEGTWVSVHLAEARVLLEQGRRRGTRVLE